MQVVDLRPGRRSAPPSLDVWASPAAELIHLAALLAHGDDASFDVGAERVHAIRSSLPDELVDAITSEVDNAWLVATRLIATLDEPGSVDGLFALLRTSPTTAWRVFLDDVCQAQEVDPAVLDAHLAGELDAATLRRTLLADELDEWHTEMVDVLLSGEPAAYGTRVLEVLERLHEHVEGTLLAEAMGPIRRDVAARREQLAAGADVTTVVVEASNGYELASDTPVDRILMTPSYWFRPWLLFGRTGSTEVLSTPVADEHLVLPSQAPPPALVKLCKALGDEGRLRLLRRMTSGPIQLADAMEELDVAKTTAHHHLAILRQAGLVVVRGEGRGTTYGLRTSPSRAVQRALADYLGPSVRHLVSGSG